MIKKLFKFKKLLTINYLPLFTFLFWRLLLSFASWLGQRFIPLKEGFLGGEGFGVWANFDGVHYLSIAQRGYIDFEQTFFPLYPLLIRFLAPLFRGNFLFSALFISHICLLTTLLLFSKLLQLDFKDKLSIIHHPEPEQSSVQGSTKPSSALVYGHPLIILLLFPTSFFFASVYSESLFLMLVLGAFLAAKKKGWGLAGILGALASATRLVGVFLLPALLVEFWQQKTLRNWKLAFRRNPAKRAIGNLIYLLFIPLSLFAYMFYLRKAFGDPLRFLHAQQAVGYRETARIILLPQVFWRYLKIFLTVSPHTFAFWVAVLEFGTTVLFLILTVFSFLKLSLSYSIFMLLSILTPTLTGTLNSMPRYVLTCFPGFILLGLINNRVMRVFLLSAFWFLLIILTAFFTRGYFIS